MAKNILREWIDIVDGKVDLEEKWKGKHDIKKRDKWGHDEKTIAQLRKRRQELKDKKKRSKALRQINFAIRSRSGWGKVKKEGFEFGYEEALALNESDFDELNEAEYNALVEVEDEELDEDECDDSDESDDEDLEEAADELSEKWRGKHEVKSIDKWGKDEKSVAQLEKRRAALKKKKKHTAAETKELRQINFALRARRGWHGAKAA